MNVPFPARCARPETNKRIGAAVWLAGAVLLAPPAFAQGSPPPPQPPADRSTAPEPVYLDDRSDPRALIRSLYNAVSRKEYVRAWSYFRDEPDRPSFESFAKGYAGTADVQVKFGRGTSDGAAGSIYYSQPVAIRSVDAKGKASVFTGCYQLRLVQPAVQSEPPFRPLGIVKGKLAASDKSFGEANGACPQDGL